MEFCNRIKELRTEKHLKQAELAKLAGLTPRAYQLYEQGDGFPTFKRLLALADFFGVSLDYLVGRSDKKEVSP